MKDYEAGWLNYRLVSKVPDEIKGLVHIYCSVTVSYTHLTLPTNSRV